MNGCVVNVLFIHIIIMEKKMKKSNLNTKNKLRAYGINVLLFSSHLFMETSLYAMDNDKEKSIISSPQSNIILNENKINKKLITPKTVLKTFDYAQVVMSVSSFGCRLYNCPDEAEKFESWNNIIKFGTGLGRIALGGWNIYKTKEKEHIGCIAKGILDLFSVSLEDKISKENLLIKNKKEEQQKKEIEIEINKKNNFIIEHLEKERNNIRSHLERYRKFLKTTEKEEQKEEIREWIIDEEKKDVNITRDIELFNEKSKKLNNEFENISRNITSNVKRAENYDKCAYIVQIAGGLVEERKTNTAKAVGLALGKSAALDPVRTLKYGAEITEFFYSIFKKFKEKKEKNNSEDLKKDN
jgi:hypothetical protein